MKTTQQAAENLTKACREFARVVRKALFCSRGIHCRMKYDSGFKHDFLGAGTCQDCGKKNESRIPPAMPRVKTTPSHEFEEGRYIVTGAKYIGEGKWKGMINGVESELIIVKELQ